MTESSLAGSLVPQQVRRLEDGRHGLFVRARDAAGNWGPVRRIALPVDRMPPSLRASGVRRANVVEATLLVHETDSGLAKLRYRVEVGGKPGRWHAIALSSRVHLTPAREQGPPGDPARERRRRGGQRRERRLHDSALAGTACSSG